MYKVYSLKKEARKTLDILLSDDIIGRQTIIYRNADNYGGESDSLYVILEGTEAIFSRIAELKLDDLKEVKNGQKIYEKVKEEEDEAESGMGFMFGR
ncbi:MAG: hypothetical protein QW597_00845 [Thermoplasmataceae archaeon]